MGSLLVLLVATALFVGSHFVLSSLRVRSWLAERLGARGFSIGYSLVALVMIVAMVRAYRHAPHVVVWHPPAGMAWVPLIVMPIAFVLAVAGLTTPSPTLVGGERIRPRDSERLAPGVLRITRHPFLWGTGLWAASHLLANGDAATVILTLGIGVLSFGGMWHIDRRRRATMGPDWEPFARATSAIPFAAVASGRVRMDWAGLGLLRPLGGLLAFATFLMAHAWLFGASALAAVSPGSHP